MSRGSIPDGFGRVYRRAVFARVTTLRGRTLAWVLVDAAYTYGSLDLELGYRLLERETGLSGWNLARAREDLVTGGLLSVRSKGKGRVARTIWLLRWNNNVRSWAHVSEGDKRALQSAHSGDDKRALKRAPERALKRAPERAPQSAHESESEFESEGRDALTRVGPQERNSKPQGAALDRDLRRRANRRGGVTDDEIQAIVERMEAEEASGKEES